MNNAKHNELFSFFPTTLASQTHYVSSVAKRILFLSIINIKKHAAFEDMFLNIVITGVQQMVSLVNMNVLCDD